MTQVNLWSAILQLSRKPDASAQAESCERFIQAASEAPKFGTEFLLGVDKAGTITFETLRHDDSENRLTLRVTRDGTVEVQRRREGAGGLIETRQICIP